MRVKALLSVLVLCAIALAESLPKEFYSGLEQHLRSLPTLEVAYLASGPAFGDSGMAGRMYWVRPDYFLHETPDWIQCDARNEQWRYLRKQNTLIRETPEGRSDWLPESVLLNTGIDLVPKRLDTADDGGRVLTLESTNSSSPGVVFMRFDPKQEHPYEIDVEGEDGGRTVYEITQWEENGAIDTAMFAPPDVPAENLIDFRTTGK